MTWQLTESAAQSLRDGQGSQSIREQRVDVAIWASWVIRKMTNLLIEVHDTGRSHKVMFKR